MESRYSMQRRNSLLVKGYFQLWLMRFQRENKYMMSHTKLMGMEVLWIRSEWSNEHIKFQINPCSAEYVIWHIYAPPPTKDGDILGFKWIRSASKVRKQAKIRNRYNQVPHLTLNTTWESDKNTIKHHKRRPRDNLQQNIEQFHTPTIGVTINNEPTTTEPLP